MQISGLSVEDFARITAQVSSDIYGGNVIVCRDAHDNGGKRRPRSVARLAVNQRGNTANWRA